MIVCCPFKERLKRIERTGQYTFHKFFVPLHNQLVGIYTEKCILYMFALANKKTAKVVKIAEFFRVRSIYYMNNAEKCNFARSHFVCR